MLGMSLGMLVETLVAVLLATTIGYCVMLNQRLKRLHADRDQLRKMVTDLVQATTLANAAIQELKTTAQEAEIGLEPALGKPNVSASNWPITSPPASRSWTRSRGSPRWPATDSPWKIASLSPTRCSRRCSNCRCAPASGVTPREIAPPHSGRHRRHDSAAAPQGHRPADDGQLRADRNERRGG